MTPEIKSLQGRVILVTGAGQGLGRATALACARAGATVILLGKTSAKLEAVYDAIIAAGGALPAIFPMDLDASADHDFEIMAQAIAGQLARLDGIVHCASAFEPPSPLAIQSVAAWQEQMQVNCIAPFAINKHCERLLKSSPDASVILIGESHGHAPAAYWGGLAASKAALEAYFKVQAAEWSDLPRLRINLVIPGPIATPQRARTHPGEDRSLLPTPETLAEDLLRLLGPDSRDIRGQLILWKEPGATL
ncbi:MAG: SDR family NAD(P)-dependent oxidoreductase [Hydrogenophilales bacterium]|nr:SDR family NAD(P)-dependent oxidoreductase [Hydrogenophilales bacterium]